MACGSSLLITFLKYDIMPKKVKYDVFIDKYLTLLRAKTIMDISRGKRSDSLHTACLHAVNQKKLLLPAKKVFLSLGII